MAKTEAKKKSTAKVRAKAAPKKSEKIVARAKKTKALTVKTKAAPRSKAKAESVPVAPQKPTLKKARLAESPVKPHAADKVRLSRPASPGVRRSLRSSRSVQYAYMRPPGLSHDFQVGDAVEVYCDHEKNRDRVRGWIRGIIVQVDDKLAAVQFRSNVYLTDGWMVPDRILWYPLNSEHMRAAPGKRPAQREERMIPDY